jgi:uncharacterized protein involved in response to NO
MNDWLGFRPFFVLAATWAVGLVTVWALFLSGHLQWMELSTHWHAHELLFGFMTAVMAGFFFTAVPRWTKTLPPTGAILLGLVATWLLGRLGMTFGDGWPLAVRMVVEVSFPVLLTGFLAWRIYGTASVRNYGFPVILAVISGADLWSFFDASSRPFWLAIHAMVLVMVVFAGRVTPLFTRNALKKVGIVDVVRVRDRRDDLTILFSSILLPALIFLEPGVPLGVLFLVAGVANLGRMVGWGFRKVLDSPISWSLQLGYLGIGVGFVVEAVSCFAPQRLPFATALHAVTLWGLGLTMYAMLSRIPLGHTGRPLRAHPVLTVGYFGVVGSAVVRVLFPAFAPANALLAWQLAAGLWVLAFVVYLVMYLPILLAPRADGKPG